MWRKSKSSKVYDTSDLGICRVLDGGADGQPITRPPIPELDGATADCEQHIIISLRPGVRRRDIEHTQDCQSVCA